MFQGLAGVAALAGVPPARPPCGVGPRGVDHPRGVPCGVDPHGVVHLCGVAVHVVHPRSVGRPRGGDSRDVVHHRDGGLRPAAAVCWTVAEVLRSRWLAMGAVPRGSCGYCEGSLELWVAVLIAYAGRGAVDGSWPVPPQPLMFLPAIPPSLSPAVPLGAQRWPTQWQSSRQVIRFLLFLSRLGTTVAARRRLRPPGSPANVFCVAWLVMHSAGSCKSAGGVPHCVDIWELDPYEYSRYL